VGDENTAQRDPPVTFQDNKLAQKCAAIKSKAGLASPHVRELS
jgi:hypothetical protein